MIDPEKFKQAAVNGLQTEETVLEECERVIANFDIAKAQSVAFSKRLAYLSKGSWWSVKARLLSAFGSALCMPDLERALKVERIHLVKGNSERQNGNFNGHKKEKSGDLPEIQINGRSLPDKSNDGLLALRAANDPPQVFVRSGQLVYVDVDERKRPSIVTITPDNLCGRLARAAHYIKRSDSSDTPSDPPIGVVRDIMALPSSAWGMPPLESIVEVPTLLPDGSLVDNPGYCERGRILYMPQVDLEVDNLPEEIHADHVDEAVAIIDDLIADIPFADQASRANYWGLILTPIIRNAISGCVPMALIDAPGPGTGKSLLADILSLIATGRNCAMMAFPRDENEQAKSLLSTLLAGRAIVCYDNFDGILSSNILAMALTAREYESRVLGTSGNKVAANRATWLATGNNIRAGGDMPRRCYHIRVDAKSTRPYQGRKYKYDDLRGFIVANRPAILRSLLLIVRAWFQAGKPSGTSDPLGSFEEWHRSIAGILKYARVDGFLSNMDSMLSDEDEMAIQWEHLLSQIEDSERFGGGCWFLVADLAQAIRQQGQNDRTITLPASLAGMSGKKGDDGELERSLGYAFRKYLGKRMGTSELYLDKGRKTNAGTKWRVLDVNLEANESIKNAEP